jgi:regulator of cell morphogenesis and NO signaling
MISEKTSVREIATLFPDVARLFDRVGIEYGCTTVATLGEACSTVGADSRALLRQIEELQKGGASSEPERDWARETVSGLVSHILQAHHAYLKEELPRLEKLMNKVYETHGKDYPELLRVHEIFFGLKDELELHLRKEEAMLFPYLLAVETAKLGRLPFPACPFGTVANPVRVMMREHDSAEDCLQAIRTSTSDFSAPPGACLGFTLLLHGLRKLEADLQEHIRLENEVLFVKALQLEKGDRVTG